MLTAATAPAARTRLEALLEADDEASSRAAEEEARTLGPDRAGTIVAAILQAELASAAGNYAPVAAARLAGDLRLVTAAPALLACVAKIDDAEDPLWQESCSAVEALGQGALEPALSAFASCRDPEGRSQLGDVLAHLRVRDDRVLDALVRNLEGDLSLATSNLVEYGDARALPALEAAFDAAPVADDGPDVESNNGVIDLAAAIEGLGGMLTSERRAKLDRELAARRDFRRLFRTAAQLASDEIDIPRAPARRAPRPGRNDPCHCGSGRKYKKCHLASEGG
jgi:SEC-C motif